MSPNSVGRSAAAAFTARALDKYNTLGCLIMLPGRRSHILGVLTAPSYRKAHWKRWGLRGVAVGCGPQIHDFRPGSIMKQPKALGKPRRKEPWEPVLFKFPAPGVPEIYRPARPSQYCTGHRPPSLLHCPSWQLERGERHAERLVPWKKVVAVWTL